jgi:outer membrane protein
MQRVRTLFFVLVLAFTATAATHAQRIAIVDINAVLEGMDDYETAQSELDRIASEWRQEIAQEYDKIKALYNKYQTEQVLLSDEARTEREDEIMEMETQVRELQKNRFGPEGALFKKRQDLIRPIQEEVYGAIEDYANDRGYDFIFDKGGSGGLIFSNPEYDKTDDIKRKVGAE